MKLFGILVSLTGLLATFSLPAFAQDIRIGVAGPMTGGEAAFGRQFRIGAEQAVADINASGGVLGRKLALEIGDDSCEPKQARSVAEKFAAARLAFVAGHFCSSSSIPASEVYAENSILQISPASTNPLFTERKLWNVFRVSGRDDQQGLVAGDYIAKNFKGRNVAILNDKSTYGKGLADATKMALNRAGITEKVFESFNRDDKDFAAIISRFKRENIDLVYLGSYHRQGGLLMRQMHDQGLKTMLMAGDALNDREFASIAGSGAEGALFTFGPDPRNNPAARSAVNRIKSRGIDPEGYVLYTYAAIQVWAKAVAQAGTLDARKVAAVIKTGAWETVLGPLSFDAKGDRKSIDYVVYRFDARGGYAELSGSGIQTAAAPALPAATTTASPVAALPPVAASPPPAPVPQTAVVAPATRPNLPAAAADRRVALIIGNSAYKSVAKLPNPQRDASLVAAAFRNVGFQSVIVQTDLGRERIQQALRDFARVAETADWAVIYYGGHGIEVAGMNYLVPIDATLATDRDVGLEAVPLDQVLNAAERAKKLRLVILDACRDNPFASQMKRTLSMASRSVSRGLAQVEPEAGTMVVYAAKHGETALDGDAANSPFATAFVKNLQTPGLEVRLLFDSVRDDVLEATGKRQQPFSYGSISARQRFYFLADK